VYPRTKPSRKGSRGERKGVNKKNGASQGDHLPNSVVEIGVQEENCRERKYGKVGLLELRHPKKGTIRRNIREELRQVETGVC